MAPAVAPKKTEFEGIAAQFAAAKAAQKQELTAGRSRDEKVKKRNEAARRQFKFGHGLLVGLLLIFVYLHGVGIFLFTKGFLLTRVVLEHKSSCDVNPLAAETSGDVHKMGAGGGCWHPRTFEKAVVVVIDALRYDFTVPFVPEDNTTKPAFYHNSFTTPYEITSAHPENAVLLPFIADPPTTTLQRLKGLTTGTLPTFIDAGSNFDGDAIAEDNIVAQMKKVGKRMAFMGDDTWMALYPGLFEEDMTHPYPSLNVWDLHEVDDGVNEHIWPLLHPKNATRWDVLFAHFLGVDHAGHRYGPDHFAMQDKLRQLDGYVKRMVELIDDKTLLIVMGDHGMDAKGDHGGESRGELEAALWMYSKKPVFGRLPEHLLPKDKQREVDQIDLVPTLSILLGLPIPFNSLGAPIAEAFLRNGAKEGWRNLAQATRLTAAQIKRYYEAYSGTKNEDLQEDDLLRTAWNEGQLKWQKVKGRTAAEEYMTIWSDYKDLQEESLRICKRLWARFDLYSMGAGVAVLVGSVAVLAIYARGFTGDRLELTDTLLTRMRNGVSMGTVASLPFAWLLSTVIDVPKLYIILFGTAVGIIGGFISASVYASRRVSSVLPCSPWGWLSLIIAVLYSVMFGSNSFVIWEDKILNFFLATFAVGTFVASQRNPDTTSRMLGSYHSVIFLILTRLASFSSLCREEQMPYCASTFYASAANSVSATWTLLALFAMSLVLPSIVKSFYTGSKSYQGPAVFYIGYAFRLGLFLVAIFWTLDTADNSAWYPEHLPLIKAMKTSTAQIIIAMALIAGHVGFAWSSLCMDVSVDLNPVAPSVEPGEIPVAAPPRSVILLGYANVHGSRFFLLVLSWALALTLVQKPMGALTTGIQIYQILTLAELVDINNLATSSIGPVILALLGNAHFFSTGHQATLTAIQWESAFIPLTTIVYPWSPLMIVANSLGPQILSAIAVPLLPLWKAQPKEKVLPKVAKAAATYMLFQAVLTTASTVAAGWLRRHLMLYRIFSPRFMLGGVTLLVGELVLVLVGVAAVRWNAEAVGEVFGFLS